MSLLGFDNDSYGKYHEIMTAKFLTGDFPERPKERECFRDGRRKKEKSKSKFNTESAELYISSLLEYFNITLEQKIIHDAKAQEASATIKEYFAGLGHNITRVFWTSNENDLLWLFGPDNKNPSDLVVKHEDSNRTYLTGVSLKNHSKRKAVTTANLGVQTLDEIFETNTEKIIKNLQTRVRDNTKLFGVPLEGSIKALHTLEKQNEDLLKTNASIMIEHCQQLTNAYKNKFFKFDNDEIKNVLIKIIRGEPTKIRKLCVNSFGSKIGKFSHDIYCHNDMLDKLFNIHDGYLHAKPSVGRTLVIAGKNDISIAKIGIKGKTCGGFCSPIGIVRGVLASALA